MYRELIKQLADWKDQEKRMPILLDGARQVGKSYLLKNLFGKVHFDKSIVLDFLEDPSLANIFKGQKTVSSIVENIQIQTGVDLDLKTDLLILDEIGECQEAVDSLKYFSEQAPNSFVCASGSNIGLLDSYPVGKVQELKLTPMNFEEFLTAHENEHIVKAYQDKKRNDAIHAQLWNLYLEYNFVGGMPEAVKAWIDGDRSKINSLILTVRTIQKNLIKGYVRDFGKFATSKNYALHIEKVFQNIPIQLAREINGSVKRYQFSNVIPKKKGYSDLSGPIDFLAKCGLVSKNYTIEGKPKSPLLSQISQSRFKLFLHDIGLLNCMLEITFQEIINQSLDFKGYIAENFVQNEIISLGLKHTYSWKSSGDAELEFIAKTHNGEILPIEVKSGKHTKAKSLSLFINNYEPKLAFKFVGTVGGFRDTSLKTLPLYYSRKYFEENFSI